MSSASVTTTAAPRPYQRQTPTVWQALGRTIWHTLEQVGQRRAARELREIAQRVASFNPALAEQLRAAASHDTVSAIKEPR
jgi:hypothetical protein